MCACLGRKAVFIVADEAEANRVCEDLACLGTTALLLPARDLSLRRVESTSREYEQMRLGTLAKMAAGDYQCVVACADAAAQFTLPARHAAAPDAAAAGGDAPALRQSVRGAGERGV